MGRIRTVKPEFFTDEELSCLPAETHLFAAGLLCYSDDDGYFNANPALVKAAVFPLREPSVSTHDMLAQLAKIGFVRLGTGANGKNYGQVVKFAEHQRVNRPTPSKIKNLEIQWNASLRTHGGLTEDSLLEGKGKEGNGREGSICAELDKPASAPPVLLLPCKGEGPKEYPVSSQQIAEWTDAFPAVDVSAELKKAKVWLNANPTRGKTHRGMAKFIVGWLTREQDKGRPVAAKPNGKATNTSSALDYQTELLRQANSGVQQ